MEGTPTPFSGPAIASMFGHHFGGDPWVVMIDLVEPLEETAFAIAIEPQVVEQSKGKPTGVTAILMETPFGYILLFKITLYDRPQEPLELRLPVNPAKDAGAEMLRRFAAQETIQLLFFDCRDGSDIGRRILRLDPEMCDAVTQSLALAEAKPSTPELWQNAIRAASDYL